MNFKNRHILSIKDFSRTELLFILKTATQFKKKRYSQLLRDKILASLFFEPSTRTKFSFDSAMEKLGGRVIGFANSESTSAKKGETLADSIRVMEKYVDIFVIRHPLEGAVRWASENVEKPVINGGDGANQHPTQTMLDLFSIRETQGRLDKLKIALAGDLKYGRTIHSLVQALIFFKPRLYFISPETLKLPNYLKEELKASKINFSEHKDFGEVIRKINILYMTRIQKERFPDLLDYEKVKNLYILNVEDLKKARSNFKILHPLPRVNEIEKAVDKTKHAYYFQQAENGLFVRQALLTLLLGKKIS